MPERELVVLGSAARAPTRTRNHNGYLLRWDGEAILFDPGEGSQRQLLLAGISANRVSRICITHFHGDHCLGLPGVLLRRDLDHATTLLDVHFPAEHAVYFDRLLHTTPSGPEELARGRPTVPGVAATTPTYRLVAAALEHRVPTLGWRLEEADDVTMLPDRLAALGVAGAAIGELKRAGAVQIDGRVVRREHASVPRQGQSFAFVMDTVLCDAAFELAAGVDLLVCEATFLSSEAALARAYGHLTAAEAGRIAAEAGARRLVLTHFSARYRDAAAHVAEARAVFDDVVAAVDLERIPVPERVSVG
jgi:ribonuclease Z